MPSDKWPLLILEEWQDTLATLHMWTQIIGKIRMAQTPLVNHFWNVPLYVSPRGLTTSAMRYEDRLFEIEFDFIDHKLLIGSSNGKSKILELRSEPVADFYGRVMAALEGMKMFIEIWPVPVEVPNPIPFEEDETHATYDGEYVNRWWRALVNIDEVFKEFRGRFLGKCSPVHFWWGSFDHAVTRFSGRPAPPREGADKVTQEAYSHECISHGFWPGGNGVEAAFYSYTAPEPHGLTEARIEPGAGFYSQEMKEFLLPYDAVRRSPSPETALIDFLQSTYEAGANLAKWDRERLERPDDRVLTMGGSVP
jgi:hypothetical protein